MVLVYTSEITSRIEYTLNIIFREVLSIEFQITSDLNKFSEASCTKLVYDAEYDGPEHIIEPCGLLNETGVHFLGVQTGAWNKVPTLFFNRDQEIPFDLMAAVFYLVSRYEEYLPYTPDEHGRFSAKNSIAFKSNFLRIPVVDMWCIMLAEVLGIRHQCPGIDPAQYEFQLTVDIDQPWLFSNKGPVYAAGSLVRELLAFNIAAFLNRLSVLLRLKHDPGNTFALLRKCEKRLGKPIKYFVLMRGDSEFDKNRSAQGNKFKKLLLKLRKRSQIGIHPSYSSNSNTVLLDHEIDLLKAILGSKVSISRQHYLKLNFPVTFQNLISRGIKEEYSLGYTRVTGFRSGIARSYPFYDLHREVETGLRLHPLIIMDRTLKDQMQYEPEQAREEFKYFQDQIKKVGGDFICLWHNDAISDFGEWKGWQQVFLEMIDNNARHD